MRGSSLPIEIPAQPLADFCRRWGVQELALFGSVLREDFRPDSDVDVLVTFAPGSSWSLFDVARMEDELKSLLGRDVDLVERRAVERSENYIRRKRILENPLTLYVA
jgi:predicted nucleotidyltransferase